MIKKATFILVFTLCFLINIDSISALDFSGNKGFYSSIADDIGNIEKKFYTVELIGEVGTKEKVNSLSSIKCLKENLSEDEINQIVYNEDLTVILNDLKTKIESSCLDADGNISVSAITDLLEAVFQVHNEAVDSAREKTAQAINIDSTGIYVDGIEGNAPFDLINDIKKIDKIIFAEKTTSYNGANDFNLDKELSKMLGVALEINRSSTDNVVNDEAINLNDLYTELRDYNSSNSDYIYSSYVCSAETTANNSGLSKDSISLLVSGDNYTPIYSDDYNYFNSNPYGQFGQNSSISPNSSYSKVNDDSVFPCTSFFCINIDFVTYRHQLLNYGKDMSIEDIISRSNEHLKKFAGTSLIQSEMTINNFQLGLRNLNLPDTFHIGVEVTSKPVPILNLSYGKNEETKYADKGIFEIKEQLRFYYKAYGLEYDRRNDLSIFEKIDADRQIALSSNLLTPTEQSKRFYEEMDEYEQKKLEQKSTMRALIENKTKISIVGDLETQFKELEVFNKSIKDYVENLKALIGNLLKIPVDSGTT